MDWMFMCSQNVYVKAQMWLYLKMGLLGSKVKLFCQLNELNIYPDKY